MKHLLLAVPLCLLLGNALAQTPLPSGALHTPSGAGSASVEQMGCANPAPYVDGTGYTNPPYTVSGPCGYAGFPYPGASGGSGSSNTVAGTSPGTSASTANPVQGVTGGVPLPTLDSTDRTNDAGTSRDQTHDDTLAVSQTGSGLKMQPVPLGSPQQTPAGDTSVAVAASTSTAVWTTSAAARVLRIVPSNATCFMRSDGGTASATSTPIPGGYVFNLVEPPPNANVTAFCTTAANVAVSQGN